MSLLLPGGHLSHGALSDQVQWFKLFKMTEDSEMLLVSSVIISHQPAKRGSARFHHADAKLGQTPGGISRCSDP